ncbi:MAG TPA: hypothetical protein PKY81_13360 [bacterium]|nr:hypothetical protein [bacterium]HPN31936.1 hypothetical protein [bacterium]
MLILAGCADTDFEKIEIEKKPNFDFDAGTQPYSVDFIVDEKLLNRDYIKINNNKYVFGFLTPVEFKPESIEKFQQTEYLTSLINPSAFINSKIINVFRADTIEKNQDKNAIKNNISYLSVSRLNSFNESNILKFAKRLETEYFKKNYSINFTRLLVNKIFMVNQFIIFPANPVKDDSFVLIKLIFSPMFYEYIQIDYILNFKYYKENLKSVESSIGSFALFNKDFK